MFDLSCSDASEWPLVSICIPNYNMGTYLRYALESALAQDYSPLEVVVVDNASTDCSPTIIEEFAQRDSRLRWVRNPQTVPMSVNWNRCLQLAHGAYFNLLSADDMLTPMFVSRCMEMFRQDPRLVYVAAERSNIDVVGRVTKIPSFFDNNGIIPGLEKARLNLVAYHFLPVQLLIQRDAADKLGNYDERYDLSCDIDLMLKLSLYGDVGYLRAPLCYYRTHAQNITSNYKRSKLGVMELYRLKYHVLNNLPSGAEGLIENYGAMLQGLARVCLGDAHNALAAENRELARENLALAQVFWGDVVDSPRYRFLINAIKHPQSWSLETLTSSWARVFAAQCTGAPAPPYPLPPGSRIFVPPPIY